MAANETGEGRGQATKQAKGTTSMGDKSCEQEEMGQCYGHSQPSKEMFASPGV